MSNTIRVQPAARLRQDFARWATEQTPKIRTSAPNTFAVPAGAFVQAPEEILIGALVDGVRYVSPAEDEQQESPEPVWTPPVLPEQEAVPGGWLPPLPDSAYGPDSVPLDPPEFAPLEDAPTDIGHGVPATPDGEEPVLDDAEGSDSSDSASEEAPAAAPYECDLCERDFPTERGRDTHRRLAHTEAGA